MLPLRGISSVGRALAWHARGQEFDSPMLHHFHSVVMMDGVGYGFILKVITTMDLHNYRLPIGAIICG